MDTNYFERLGDEGSIARPAATGFEANQLHDRTQHGWAVIELPSGAIAEDERGDLLMRFYEEEARRAAAAMTWALNQLTRTCAAEQDGAQALCESAA